MGNDITGLRWVDKTMFTADTVDTRYVCIDNIKVLEIFFRFSSDHKLIIGVCLIRDQIFKVSMCIKYVVIITWWGGGGGFQTKNCSFLEDGLGRVTEDGW